MQRIGSVQNPQKHKGETKSNIFIIFAVKFTISRAIVVGSVKGFSPLKTYL